MKRKLKWLAIVLAVSLLGFGTALLLWPRDRITVESWQKIRLGMTEEEVAEILGRRGMSPEEFLDQYNRLEQELLASPFRLDGPGLDEPAPRALDWDRGKIWTGRRGMIQIELDQDNHVRWKGFQPVRWINGGVVDRFRDWLGW